MNEFEELVNAEFDAQKAVHHQLEQLTRNCLLLRAMLGVTTTLSANDHETITRRVSDLMEEINSINDQFNDQS